jgi:hypothetical protein
MTIVTACWGATRQVRHLSRLIPVLTLQGDYASRKAIVSVNSALAILRWRNGRTIATSSSDGVSSLAFASLPIGQPTLSSVRYSKITTCG